MIFRAVLAVVAVLAGTGAFGQREPGSVGAVAWADAKPASAGAAIRAAAKPASGVRGLVTVYPTCGGPVRSPPRPGCDPAPLRVAIRIASVHSGRTLRTIHSGGDGHYRATLRPGSYVLTPLRVHGRALPFPPRPARVRVRASHHSRRDFEYDSGLL